MISKRGFGKVNDVAALVDATCVKIIESTMANKAVEDTDFFIFFLLNDDRA